MSKNKKENYKVSIIIPTYRRSKSLRNALVSLENQSYDNVEIIVVDDNADEKWSKIVRGIIKDHNKSSKNKINYLVNEENMGSAKSRNIGIEEATGKYITFLDDDDLYLQDKVKKQVEHMIRKKSDYSLTDLWLYDENDKLIEKRTRDYIKDLSVQNLNRYHLKYHMTGTDSMMFKKNYLLEIGMFPSLDIGDEFYLMHNAINNGGVFSYLRRCDIKAYVHFGTKGLSSGEGKITGEKQLFEYKKRYFNILSSKDIKYIKMRHYAVLAYAELRRSHKGGFIKNLILSFISNPIGLYRLFIERMKWKIISKIMNKGRIE